MNVTFFPPTRKIERIFIHCSASDSSLHDDISVIRKWHTTSDPNDPSKPWRDVGYHYFIKFDGTIQAGRPLEVAPAAQGARHNARTIAICLAGGQHGSIKAFTEAQFAAVRELCQAIALALPSVTFHGHCEVSPKLCPVFNYHKILGLGVRGEILATKE